MSHFSEKKVKSRQKTVYLYSFMAKAFKYSQMDVNICYNLEEKPYKQERWNTSKMGIAELQSELEGFPLTCKGKPGQ